MRYRVTIYGWRWAMKPVRWIRRIFKVRVPVPATSHVALEIIYYDGENSAPLYAYLSFWPIGWHLNPLSQTGTFNPGYDADKTIITGSHRRYSDTVIMAIHRGGNKPLPNALRESYPVCKADWAYDVVSLSAETVRAMAQTIDEIRSNHRAKYHLVLNNCAVLISGLLKTAGIFAEVPDTLNYRIWTPDRIRILCEYLERKAICIARQP